MVQVRIDFEGFDPPQGALAIGSDGIAFSGWLDLIGLLERMLLERAPDRTARADERLEVLREG